jgi:5-formyltetrahydrofolate cyclo-ligase
MDNDKELLRVWLKKKRLAVEPAEVERLSGLVCQRLIKSVKWENIKSVHCYTTIKSLNEVDTAPVFEFIKTNYPQIKVFQQGQDSIMPLTSNRFDLIVVPVLGFDSRLHRLGWGGGFYDRFLASQPQALKAGLCLEAGFVKKAIPTEGYDVALNLMVTEKRVLKKQP